MVDHFRGGKVTFLRHLPRKNVKLTNDFFAVTPDQFWLFHSLLEICVIPLFLCWQLERLPLDDFGDVKVEEVAVEDGLNAAGHNGNYVVEAFCIVSVDPVDDVECPVGSECEQVVGGDGLGLARLGDHEELR